MCHKFKPTTMSQDQERLSPEEVKKRQDKTMEFYKEQMPYLEATLKYEEIVAHIEEYRTRQMAAVVKRSQMMAPPPQPEEAPSKSSIITND